MNVEVIAKGTDREWTKYTPEGCAMFFMNRKLAEDWERLSKERGELIKKFYASRKIRRINSRVEAIMSLNEMHIHRASQAIKHKKALKIAKKHAKENPGCKCPWCRMAGG